MERFDRWGVRRFSARSAVIAIAICALVLIACAGASVRKAGEEMSPGIGRELVLAVGRPAGWLSDQLPLRSVTHTLTAWLSPDTPGTGPGGFASSTSTTVMGGIPPVTPDAFDSTDLGTPPPPRRPLHTLLVTGDSMSQPLDLHLAQTLATNGIKVIRDPHIGTGISKSILVDWGKLATSQMRQYHPDAIVIFIGANEGFSMPGPAGRSVDCCSALWAAMYAERARRMMNTYRRAGNARVYWLTLPTPRDATRARIARVVNAAIRVAAEPWRAELRILDMVPVFTPNSAYRDSMTVNGRPTIVRESDGIHLNDAGAALAAQLALNSIDKDFTR